MRGFAEVFAWVSPGAGRGAPGCELGRGARAQAVGLGAVLAALMGSLFVFGVPVASADSCPNAVFRTGPSASLPDCRAYELVTPPFKAGGIVTNPEAVGAVDGANLLLSSLGAFGNPLDNSNAGGSDYAVARTASGWVSTPIDPPVSQFEGGKAAIGAAEVSDVSQDFSRSLFGRVPRSAKPVDKRFYIRQPDGSLVEVGPALSAAALAAWTPSPGNVPEVRYLGGSEDLSHVLFSIKSIGVTNFQWPGDATLREGSVYEYVGTGNSAPRLVGLDNSGHQISQCGTYLGADTLIALAAAFNAVSSNGAKVFFSAHPGGCKGTREGVTVVGTGPSVAEVYARIGGSETVAVSEPSVGDCSACDTAPAQRAAGIFQGASRDGSKAFFLTSQPLLGGDSTRNLYLYDFNAPAGQRVVRVSAGDPSGANVQGVARISQDGSRVYFVAGGVLTGVPNSLGQSAVASANNLYLYEPDPANPGQFKNVFVAALSGSDNEDWSLSDSGPVEATPDGRFLLFVSTNGLTPDCVACTGQQIYRYDAQSGALVRVSIGENGFNQNGILTTFASIVQQNYTFSLAAPRAVSISDDGSYVFFQSPEGLTPQALNNACVHEEEGKCFEYEQNIYEYHEGHVYLISDGQDRHLVVGGQDVVLIGASPSGGDVFFTTADPLVAQDTDTQMDVYDARIDGGFPATAAPVSCQGEGCQGGLSASPSGQVPGSFAFSGPGNPAPTHVVAKRGKKKQHGNRKRRHHRRRRAARKGR